MRTQAFTLGPRTLHPQTFNSRVAVLFAGLLGFLIGIGCDNAQETEHDAPRDVEVVADSSADGEATAGDTAAADVADTAQGDAAAADVADIAAPGDSDDGAAADARECPPGAQIEGCPCTKPVLGMDYGCCLGMNWGLTCTVYQGKYAWGVTWDCCTKEAPYCGDKPPSGKDALCDSKTFP